MRVLETGEGDSTLAVILIFLIVLGTDSDRPLLACLEGGGLGIADSLWILLTLHWARPLACQDKSGHGVNTRHNTWLSSPLPVQ